ncbi:Glutathione S-transferase Mu 5 [Galemys pyrenaicus]|uniref:Glutathione S-transferase Mu 5 n=1 Tax=Galemys pyrenaicus TaxID=202257 RepID=A0A8J6AT50_GALPY|nr:Glutathione S-transferase Mu 5 [Galemys pyrenaicus]
MSSTSAMVLDDWNHHRLTKAIHTLLEFIGTSSEKEQCTGREAPDHDRSQCLDGKFKLDWTVLTFPTSCMIRTVMFDTKCLDEITQLKTFMCHFDAFKKITAFKQSEHFVKLPTNKMT